MKQTLLEKTILEIRDRRVQVSNGLDIETCEFISRYLESLLPFEKKERIRLVRNTWLAAVNHNNGDCGYKPFSNEYIYPDEKEFLKQNGL